ncbi:minor tail protein [Mycobacterium phage Iwokeuplikedis]|nr:minor tail protein [Mycobacterium phage Iwokeuplikedis]
MTPFNPDSWMDVIALAVLAAFSFAGIVAPVMLSNHRKQSQTLETVREHVANSHTTNLRDDIDEINRLVREGLRDVRQDIGGLREELRTERIERIEGDKLRVVFNKERGAS